MDLGPKPTAKKRKNDWFKGAKNYHDDVLKHFYKAVTRARISSTTRRAWSPSVSLKCYKKMGRFEAQLYDDSPTPRPLDLEELTANRLEGCQLELGDWSFC